jgi:S1-C subfamily serine protease
MSELAAQHSLVGAGAGTAAATGLMSSVWVSDVIIHVDSRATAAPDGLYRVTLTKAPADRVSVKYVRDGTAATTILLLARW